MELVLNYYRDKVKVLNPEGNAILLTLWSKTEYILEKLGEIPSNLAAASQFYGDGISQLLANLLNNPQISNIFITGNNRAGSLEELQAFFTNGVESIKLNGSDQCRIKGTNRLINVALAGGPDLFKRVPGVDLTPTINVVPGYKTDNEFDDLREAIKQRRGATSADRYTVQLLEPKFSSFPSIQAGHQVTADKPLDAWAEVLFLISRYGIECQLGKGGRKELLNLKVVITDPTWQQDEDYEKYGLNNQKLRKYAADMLQPDLPPDTSYTYGHRLRTYFGFDSLDQVAARLLADKEDRKCYITTWDQIKDMEDDRGHPCMVGLFFRVFQDKLTLSVTFRTHRAYTAWIENVHGLMNLQQVIAERTKIPPGFLTVISHSISIDPSQMAMVESITAGRKWKLRDDSRGELMFSINDGQVVVEHKMSGLTLKRYESSNIEALAHRLAQDYVISDLNHALYVGRQLGKLQLCLKHGLEYEEA